LLFPKNPSPGENVHPRIKLNEYKVDCGISYREYLSNEETNTIKTSASVPLDVMEDSDGKLYRVSAGGLSHEETVELIQLEKLRYIRNISTCVQLALGGVALLAVVYGFVRYWIGG